ncbi:hypothetical protein EJB05_42022, partial [Eragrostis curvula]
MTICSHAVLHWLSLILTGQEKAECQNPKPTKEQSHYPDEREGDGVEHGRQEPDGAERSDVRAGGDDQKETERDAADLEAVPQRVGDVGPPDRPRHPHDRGAPASAVRVHLVVVVTVAVAVPVVVVVVAVVVMMMAVLVVAAAMAAVRAGGEEQRATREEERLFGYLGEGFGRRGAAATAEVRERQRAREAEEMRGRPHRFLDGGGGE